MRSRHSDAVEWTTYRSASQKSSLSLTGASVPRSVAFGSQTYPGISSMRFVQVSEIMRRSVAKRDETVRMPGTTALEAFAMLFTPS